MLPFAPLNLPHGFRRYFDAAPAVSHELQVCDQIWIGCERRGTTLH
jgi:hypothetical protein